MKDLAIWVYLLACGFFMLSGLIACGILDISPIIQRLRGGRYELWYMDFPVCDTVWHYAPIPNERPNGICRGSVIKVREYKGIRPFRRK